MEEKDMILNEVVTPMEETEKKEEVLLPKKPKNNFKKIEYKTKRCSVISYSNITKNLDVKFDKYGIRIKNVNDFNGDKFVEIKYKGEIGKPNFEYRL